MRRVALLATTCLLAGISFASGTPLAADTPQTSPSGATLSAPKAWSVSEADRHLLLTAPEGNLHLVIVDAGHAADARAAVKAAWQLYRPDEKHTLKVVAPAAAREGWDEAGDFEYETSPNEHLVIQATAFRSADNWTVLIFDGNEATFEKREGAVLLVEQSLRPKGYQRESFAGRTPHPLDAARVSALRDFVSEGMQKLRIPGVGLALTQHGKLVYEGGLGVRELGKPETVDAHTLFMIASNTKGLTTLLLARLVDQGKLGWNQPVTQVYPDFRLGNAETTRQVQIRHLICACTGIPRRDLEWLLNTHPDTPASDTFKQLADTQPTSRFGEVFQYSNLMASAAGYIGGHIAYPDLELGAAYDRALQSEILDPLGMKETTFDYARVLAGDHASPHADTIDGKVVVASMDVNYTIIPFRPAGAAWSSADDMMKYVEDELTPGRLPDGTEFISAHNVLARRSPSVPIGEDASYGMGLMTDRHDGVLVVHHGGDMIGFHSDWFAITDAGVGAVILTNGDNGYALRKPFGRRLLELLYDGKPEAEKQLAADAAQIDAEIAKERPYLSVPPDLSASAGLAHHYTNPSLGGIAVSQRGDRVFFNFGIWKSEVASRKNDDGTISFVTIDPGNTGIPFVVTHVGGKRGLDVHDGQHVYTYIEG
jgi:CubicO group peptidase (beta-lactamase class C family)